MNICWCLVASCPCLFISNLFISTLDIIWRDSESSSLLSRVLGQLCNPSLMDLPWIWIPSRALKRLKWLSFIHLITVTLTRLFLLSALWRWPGFCSYSSLVIESSCNFCAHLVTFQQTAFPLSQSRVGVVIYRIGVGCATCCPPEKGWVQSASDGETGTYSLVTIILSGSLHLPMRIRKPHWGAPPSFSFPTFFFYLVPS